MELEKALKVIREECKKHEDCGKCPLRTYTEGCTVKDKRPDKWELVSDGLDDGAVKRLFV